MGFEVVLFFFLAFHVFLKRSFQGFFKMCSLFILLKTFSRVFTEVSRFLFKKCYRLPSFLKTVFLISGLLA